jgi:hypothetical protein
MKTNSIISVLVGLALFTVSCRKAEVDTETQSAQDDSFAEAAYARTMPTVQSIGITEDGIKRIIPGMANSGTCAQVTILGNVDHFPDSGAVTVVIDYGAGCVDNDNVFKKGKIKAVFPNKWNVQGTQIDITFEDYHIYQNVNLQGSMVIKNNGNNSYTVNVVNGKCLHPDWTIFYSSTRTTRQIAGADTPEDPSDDAYEISGNSNGTSRKDLNFASSILDPIVKRNSCKWFEKGIVEIVPEGLSARTIDFGPGTCDDDATVTINGNKYEFKLK